MKRFVQIILFASSVGGMLAAACIGNEPSPLPAISHDDGGGAPSTADAGLPSSIRGLALWLDGADPATVELVAPNDRRVARWKDKSTNNWHFRTPDGGAPPRFVNSATNNGKTAIGFTRANNEYLEGPGLHYQLTAADAFIVAETTRVTGNDADETYGLWGFSPSPTRHPFIASDGGGLILQETFGSSRYWVASPPDPRQITTLHLYQITTRPKAWIMRLNTVQVYEIRGDTVTVAFMNDRVILGNTFSAGNVPPSYAFNGTIAELVVFDRELSPEERDTVNAYLIEKWAIRYPDGGRL
ncbi:hypothetical protein [Pendulispora albinea]|uniref:LamG domain-containing protein n=1 Tax=Pendulispora albinea TaxID=2741071 RepID=A0ABZ2M7K0_9BACT